MSWAQASLLARGLCRGWGGICGAALTGAPFSQVTTSRTVIGVEGGGQALDVLPAPPDSTWWSQLLVWLASLL